MLLRLADPDERYAAVRLCSDLHLSDEGREYVRDDGEWRLELLPPPIARLEYQLEVVRRDGGSERVCDPGNANRAPGAFGEKSVLLLPGYAAPRWLRKEGFTGSMEELAVRGRGLGTRVRLRIWSPADADPAEPLPLLAAHDGPEYDELAALTHFSAVAMREGELPRHRVALLAPGDRDEWYSASARYAGALVRDVLPAIRDAVAVRGAPVGMGASLGALAMLHAQRLHPLNLGALFLQSGSFFTPRFDAHESRFPRYRRIVRFVGATRRQATWAEPVPVALTCGTAEENVHNNRLMARALAGQGYPTEFSEVPDMHNYTAWRDAFEPHLTALLARAW
ncbi:MAG TPA: alpha/beta hydrolase-fold protein [Thermoleophilaceae bacterium]